MIKLRDVSKTFPDGTRAVDDVSISIPAGKTLCLIGTSGCGKTTTLKMINRLIEPTGGSILINGTDVTRLDPIKLRRNIGYVVQRGSLFPHMRVYDNLALLPRRMDWSEKRIEGRIDELLELIRMSREEFGSRFPDELSGGQQQRVGVARALIVDPSIILLDEPFGALDPITRADLQDEFLRLKHELNKTMAFVTHDLSEAFKLGDLVALMDFGKIVQCASPSELLSNPASEFVSDFLKSHGTGENVCNLTAGDIMVSDPLVLNLDSSGAVDLSKERRIELSEILHQRSQHVIFVVDETRRLKGMLTRKDVSDGTLEFREAPMPACSQDPISELIDRMLQNRIASYPVVDIDGVLSGAVTRQRVTAILGRDPSGVVADPERSGPDR